MWPRARHRAPPTGFLAANRGPSYWNVGGALSGPAPPRGGELCHSYGQKSLTSVRTCLRCSHDMFLWTGVLVGLALPLAALFRRLLPHFLDDCTYILRSVVLGVRLTKYKKTQPFYSIVDCFLDAAEKHPRKPFVLFEGREYSYRDVDRRSNKVARALQAAAGLREGDTVALFLANEPSFVWTWLGLAKLGCPAALLNFNIRSKSLLHCFSCCGAKVIVTSAGKTRNHTV